MEERGPDIILNLHTNMLQKYIKITSLSQYTHLHVVKVSHLSMANFMDIISDSFGRMNLNLVSIHFLKSANVMMCLCWTPFWL